ncbi:MAG TPA: ATP-binding protein [Anaerolineales bacterium]
MSGANALLRQRVDRLRWILPLGLALVSTFYQLGPAAWVHDRVSHSYHYGVEIIFYGLVGPLAVFWAVGRVQGWLEDRERLERQARATERHLAAITTASADAILSLDPGGNIESWNRGAELILGYTEKEARGKTLVDLLSGKEAARIEVQWLLGEATQVGFVRGHETSCRDASGREVLVELTATQLTDGQGTPFGISVILRDISERKRREHEIRRLNASLNEEVAVRTRELAAKLRELARANDDLEKLDRMRSEFVSLVSHQLRAPLTNVLGALSRIEASCEIPNATCTRMRAVVAQQVGRLDRLVRDVLNAARIEAGDLNLQAEPFSVLPVVRQVVQQVQPGAADRAFHLPTKPGLPMAYADRDRVVEVLANLLDNAVKYSPSEKPIAVEVRADEKEVVLSVRDWGPGLPPDDLQHVFHKFYRADSSDAQAAYGYGLGLYVCQRLVAAMGGRVWAENAADGGAVFSFSLPVAV